MKPLLLAVLLAAPVAASSAQSPVIRAHLDPAKGIIVGQSIHVVVEVLVPNFFTGTPDFPTFEVENVIVVLSEDAAINFNDTIGGQTYAGIRRAYLLYPQQPGDFQLPPAEFSIPFAKVPPKSTTAVLTLPPLTFHAEIPPAARGLSYFLPTTQLTMQQKWSSPLKNLRVGDTIERTLTITTMHMQGMLIPPLPMEAPDGIRVYPGQPKVMNKSTSRSEFISGSRIQSAKYLIQKAGDYTLPEITVTWWNLNLNRVATVIIPATHFIAEPNASYSNELPPPPEIVPSTQPKPASLWVRYRRAIFTAPVIIAAILFLIVCYHLVPSLLRQLKTRRERYRQSEGACFHNLIRACRRNAAREAYQALLRWLQTLRPHTTLTQFLEQSRDERLTRQIDTLAETLFADSAKPWQGRDLARHLRLHRKFARIIAPKRSRLPALNP